MTIFLPTSITFDLESSNLEKNIEGVTFEDKNHEIKYIQMLQKETNNKISKLNMKGMNISLMNIHYNRGYIF